MRQAFQHGLIVGGALGGAMDTLHGDFPPWRLATHPDAEQPVFAGRRTYGERDGKLTFDKLSSVFASGNRSRDDQPDHLRIQRRVPRELAIAWANLCPAQVYEVGAEGDDGLVELEVTPSNCVQCGAITAKGGRLTPPEGGSGPGVHADLSARAASRRAAISGGIRRWPSITVAASRGRHQVALRDVDAELAQERELALRLDALGRDRQAEDAPELDDHAHELALARVRLEHVDERLRELEHVHRQAAQLGQRRGAGAEVLERDAHAELAQRRAALDDRERVGRHGALGELEHERLRRQVLPLERGGHVAGEGAVLELVARDVDRDDELLGAGDGRAPERRPGGRRRAAFRARAR